MYRSGALAPGRVDFVTISQLIIGHIDVICMFGPQLKQIIYYAQ